MQSSENSCLQGSDSHSGSDVHDDTNHLAHATALGSGLCVVDQPQSPKSGEVFGSGSCPLEQPSVQGIKASISSTDCNGAQSAEKSSHQARDTLTVSGVSDDTSHLALATASGSGLCLVVQPKLEKKRCMHIPEFDPKKNFLEMPIWLRYDPTKRDGFAQYTCIVCDRPVGNRKQRIEEHARGRKHIHNMRLKVNLCYQTYDSLVTFVKERYKLESHMFTNQNIPMLAATLREMNVVNDRIVSVGFVVENGCVLCLSLVSNGISINIDRTIWKDHKIVKNVVGLKELFEGPRKLGGRNIWELMLVLFHQYGIRCEGMADLQEGSIDHAGVDVPWCNSTIHLEVVQEAAESYELINSTDLKLLNFGKTPSRVLHHICEYNFYLYSVYREICETTMEVQWVGNIRVHNSRKLCKIKGANFKSRIRKNSLVNFYIGDSMITGQCKEDVSGKEAVVALDTILPAGDITRITLNRREEMVMSRVLLRHYVRWIAGSSFCANAYLRHFYGLQSFGMIKKTEDKLKERMTRSERLNDFQNAAKLRSLFPVSMIHGPPGTGKTRTLSYIVLDAVERKQGVLCLGWTNVSVRKQCEYLKELLPDKALGILTAREYRVWHESEYKELSDVEVKDCNRQVICMTISNYLYRTMYSDATNQWAYSSSNPDLLKPREVAVVDESSQVAEVIGSMVLSRWKRYLRGILAGDHIQLAPYISKYIDNPGSILTWIRKQKGKFEIPNTMLRKQYRMMPSVGELVSDNFYGGKLVHAKDSDGLQHVFFHNLEGRVESMGASLYCKEDTMKCIDIWTSYQGRTPPVTCQVLTFYEAQCQHVKQQGSNINVCCIDSYQGQEADVIILLLTLRKRQLTKFMVDRGRVCVGLSRSLLDLHIVGNLATMVRHGKWRVILKRFINE